MKDIKMINGQFETASPESQGLSSADIQRCLEKIKATGLFMHSFHIFRNGYLVAGGCADPISLEMKRRVYSVMKSVTALAVDFNIQEGKFTLDDAIIDYYPEVKSADRNDPRLKKLTIRDVLMMCAGHERDAQWEYDQNRFGLGAIPKTYRDGDGPDLTEAAENKTLKELFFSMPFEKEPGTEFFYDNTIPEIVGMLAENASGESYYDYLTPRLFEPLDIDICRCNRIDEYDGTDRNYSATTVMSLRDMMKFGLFYLQHGSWEGKQILKPEIIDDGTRCHVETKPFVDAHADHGFSPDGDVFGYGYQIWMNRFGGFSLVGGCCQCCICIPEKNMMISFACFDRRESSSKEFDISRIIKEEVYDKISDAALPENEAARKAMDAAFEEWTSAPALSPNAAIDVAGKTFALAENELGLKSVRIDEAEKTAVFELADGSERAVEYGIFGKFVKNAKGLGHGTDGYSTIFFTDPEECFASGGWDGEDFVLELHYTAHMNNTSCRISFKDGAAVISW